MANRLAAKGQRSQPGLGRDSQDFQRVRRRANSRGSLVGLRSRDSGDDRVDQLPRDPCARLQRIPACDRSPPCKHLDVQESTGLLTTEYEDQVWTLKTPFRVLLQLLPLAYPERPVTPGLARNLSGHLPARQIPDSFALSDRSKAVDTVPEPT